MALNVFEGARRIAILIGLMWIVGWIIAGLVRGNPEVVATYVRAWPNGQFAKMESESCASDAGSTNVTKPTKSGTEVNVTLCFDAYTMTDGTRAIPYSLPKADGSVMANTNYSAEVIKYMRDSADKFEIPEAHHSSLDAQYWPALFKSVGKGALFMALGLAMLALITWAIGWIVRGFMGIPRGHDHRAS